MTKSRSHKDDEDLRGIIRELRSQNKALKRRLRDLEKSKHIYKELKLSEEEMEELVEEKKSSCPECGEGNLVYVDLGIKHLMSCDMCKYRTKAKSK